MDLIFQWGGSVKKQRCVRNNFIRIIILAKMQGSFWVAEIFGAVFCEDTNKRAFVLITEFNKQTFFEALT